MEERGVNSEAAGLVNNMSLLCELCEYLLDINGECFINENRTEPTFRFLSLQHRVVFLYNCYRGTQLQKRPHIVVRLVQ